MILPQLYIEGMSDQEDMEVPEQGMLEEGTSNNPPSSQSADPQAKQSKVKAVTKKKATVPCLCCGENCTKGQPAVKCVLCELWAHKTCLKMPDSTFKQLEQQYRETALAYWVCRPCQSFSQRVKHQFQENDKRHDETEKRVDDNSRRINEQEKAIEEMKNAMKKMAETMEREKEARDNMVCDEIQEMEARRRNLVIHGLSEAPDTIRINRERMEWDKNLCGELFQVMGARVRKEELRFCRRIGERGGALRPIVIGVEEDRDKNHLLIKARMLKGTRFDNVSIVPDLTKKQRQQEERLRSEAESRNSRLTEEDKRENLRWIVIGRRGEKRLVKGVERDREAYERTGGYVPRVSQPGGQMNNPPGNSNSGRDCGTVRRFGNVYGNGNSYNGNGEAGGDSSSGNNVRYNTGNNGLSSGNNGYGSGNNGPGSGNTGFGQASGGWQDRSYGGRSTNSNSNGGFNQVGNQGGFGRGGGNGQGGSNGYGSGQGGSNGYGNSYGQSGHGYSDRGGQGWGGGAGGGRGGCGGGGGGAGGGGGRSQYGWQENRQAGDQDRPEIISTGASNGTMSNMEPGRTRLGSKRGRDGDNGNMEDKMENPPNRSRMH